jgi:hypothetical protein
MELKQVLAGILLLVSMLALPPRGHAAPGSLFTGTGTTRDNVQAKLWFNDGTWWALLPYGGTGPALTDRGNSLYRLEGGGLVRQDLVDSRITTRADVFWNGTHLFALMYKDSNASPSKLYKYRYDAGTQTYTWLPDFPVTLPLQGTPPRPKPQSWPRTAPAPCG